MGWWRSLLPCCGFGGTTPRDASFSCCCCGSKEGMQEEVTGQQQTTENGQTNFVFLENYPTEQKILNPLVPFLGELPVALYSGRIIIIQGIVKPYAIRMSVNLACGGGSKSDLAFHLNPRFEQNLVVRNARIDNRWGAEETSSAKRFPFKRGQQFQMQILVSEDDFLVAFDGEHFCSFTYRIPLIRIQMIQVNGDVDVTELEYKKTDIYPLPYAGVKEPRFCINSEKNLASLTKNVQETPFTAELLDGLPVGSEIEIVGRVKLLPQSFYINLQEGTQIWPHPAVALHINPRFKGSSGVIQNAWVKGKWGAEISSSLKQFRAGRPFSIRIACEQERYSVSVDGAAPAYFNHRCSPDVVNAIYLHGDVWIKDIGYIKRVEKAES